ncbi:hypothetical protein CPB83DRAFT_25133 [Crepidotus variabilis]|uniref:Uncharacterized protein n=1 Tax=Crepidotus variabilis TaxID=179855 RepID=A0A9P6EV42_9AGAR|nr:hypothetical protein CPB83DRAFT_25133 [Crepidotus variabilis]
MSNQTTTIPTQPGKIFNVDEVTGKEHSALETTAAQAQLDATNRVEALHISENAENAQHVATQAASVAKSLGSEFTGEPATAAGQFKGNASKVTDAAVAEGKQDIGEAKAVTAGYVGQAKALAGAAIETAQNYLPTALGGKTGDPAASFTDPNAPPLTTQAKDAAVSAYTVVAENAVPAMNAAAATAVAAAQAAAPHVETAKNAAYNALGTASEAAAPHVETAKNAAYNAMGTASNAAQPHIENAKATAQNTLGTASVPSAPSKVEEKAPIPATSAPLESGPHTVTTPYPATTTKTGPVATDIAANDPSPVPTRN